MTTAKDICKLKAMERLPAHTVTFSTRLVTSVKEGEETQIDLAAKKKKKD